MTNVLFTFPVKEYLIEELQTEFPEVKFTFSSSKDQDALKSAEVIVTYGEDISVATLDQALALKWLMIASAGLEKMPLSEILKRNIFVTNVKGIHKTPMTESVMAHLLAIKRALPWMYKQQENSEWSKRSGSTELFGSTALIIGPGAIGSEIGRLLQAFGVTTIGCNRSGKNAANMNSMITFDQLSDVLPKVDIVISVLPSTPETIGLLTYDHFVLMKEDAIFMNFGRGDLIKEEQLIQAIQERQISYAVLDVFENEPLDENHPFWKMEGVIVSPHVSSHSSEYVPRALKIFRHNLHEWIEAGTNFQNVIDLEKGY
ncbi:D-2-hydroxyacid dehydrogenase [Paenisporosarcina quisquiliarum]|uniref:D-2-hydroxyacid dehydrogenase n=1 Tax=Paenisporosarcina quisquiliarum TaxID=365346 RepID=A0A9X3LFJ1_9BACL|nr:D-2-hydroxyacid dehydrogenase [Paenisporosarcina quisquiliarum]MCZ8536968.1 D-2-hydroxyacid dehydrogenase [Paenisporosarcina quisquiliarum]